MAIRSPLQCPIFNFCLSLRMLVWNVDFKVKTKEKVKHSKFYLTLVITNVSARSGARIIQFYLKLHLVKCKIFFKCKIFSGESIFGKGKNFLVFGCILKIILENNFQCLVTFWKYYFPTKFSHFLNFQTNFISQNPPPPPPTHQHPQKIHHYPHKTHHHTTQKLPKQHHPHHHKKIKK